ncbi:MAG: hypothetical protein FWD14_04240 [Treponema sp.]|nr:hypothetical protein [Treponema sp.]
MKRFNIFLVTFAVMIIALFAITSCDNLGTINTLTGGLKTSIQVNNGQGARSAGNLTETDIVELYIENFEYLEDAQPRALMVIAKGDRDLGSLNKILNNAGWYSAHADLEIANSRRDTNSGSYSCFFIGATKLRINGTEYDLTLIDDVIVMPGALYGKPSPGSRTYAGNWPHYPDNFNGIMVTGRTREIKTILTIEPEIIGIPNTTGYDSRGLSTNPFKFIKVEGIIFE